MKVDFIEKWGTDKTVARAARVSFNSDDLSTDELSAKDERLIHYLAKNKHTSCFEHMGATLKLKVPIFIARQIQRHRAFAYNEISRRYVDSEPEFFWPDKWRARAENAKQGSSDEALDLKLVPGYPNDYIIGYLPEQHLGWSPNISVKGFENIVVGLYNQMLEQGFAPEQARMILPQNLYTEMYMSGNLRSWSHFLHLRLDGHAQAEVRVVAEQVKDILTPIFPISMEALLTYDTK